MFTQHGADPDDWKDVVAPVKAPEDTTLWNLRMLLKLAYIKHESLFANDCCYEPLAEAQFGQLVQEYEVNVCNARIYTAGSPFAHAHRTEIKFATAPSRSLLRLA